MDKDKLFEWLSELEYLTGFDLYDYSKQVDGLAIEQNGDEYRLVYVSGTMAKRFFGDKYYTVDELIDMMHFACDIISLMPNRMENQNDCDY